VVAPGAREVILETRGLMKHFGGVYILEKGQVRYEGTMARFLGDEEVRRAHLAV
jgi:hypothetical protein